MRLALGLRPRLLAALVFTSAVTLATAALALLSPLQERLRDQTTDTLEASALTARPGIEQALEEGRDLGSQAVALAARTDARVAIVDGSGTRVYDTDPFTPVDRMDTLTELRTLRLDRTTRRQVEDGARIGVLLRADGERYVLLVRKPFTAVAGAVDEVRSAFGKAALVGLLVALLLGLALTTTLLRRLARLRQVAQQITARGADASPPPRDDSRDEVGDVARALASMQVSLRRQEEARRAFVATASHELRTPLTSLQGMLELLDEDLREGRLDLEDAREQLEGARGQLRRLEHLAADLLDLSRLDSDQPLRREPVELDEVCRAVAAEFALRATEQGARIDVERPPGPCWAAGDPGAVARIARILLDNALRFSPPGAAVRIAAAYHGETATLEVADAGPGVPPDERERIFERFQRGSRTGGEGGFGLGLAIGRELAERLGGRLELLGAPAGARFRLSLPIELPAGSGSAREPQPEPVA